MKGFFKITLAVLSLTLSQSCTNYTTNLNSAEKFQISAIADIKQGEACSNNLFGGFTLPYFGDTAIRLQGDESVIAAIKNANINSIFAVDRKVNNYVIWSKRCTIVFGKLKESELNVKEIPTVSGSTTTPASTPTTSAPVVPTMPAVPSI